MDGVARQTDAPMLTTDCSICLCFVLKRNDVFKYRIHGSGSKAKIIEGNIIASNGVIHITNSLLTHEPNAVGDITVIVTCYCYRCHYTKSNPIDDHTNISSKKLQKQNIKPLGHYTCMQCGTSHLQTVQENILSRIILATYRKFTVATVRFTQNVSCNIYTHPIYQQVTNVTV